MVLSEKEKMLNSARGFLVAATRFTGEATLIVDNARNIERAVTRNAGDKTSAAEIAAASLSSTAKGAAAVALGLGAAFVERGVDPDREQERSR